MSKPTFKEFWQEEHRTKSYYQILIDSSKKISEAILNKKSDAEIASVLEKTFNLSAWNIDEFYELIDIYEEKEADSDRKRTNPTTIKLAQKIAKLLDNNNPFIDWALGFGSFLIGMGETVHGQDINSDMLEIAQAYLLLNGVSIENIDVGDSLTNPKQKDGVIFFDPPLGGQQSKPTEWKKDEVIKILGSSEGKTAPELLFVTSFLLNATNNSHFIGLVTESFIARINSETVKLRKYLIENSLKAVIRLQTGLLMLIGVKSVKQNKDEEIPVIRLKDGFPADLFLQDSFLSFDDFIAKLGDKNLIIKPTREALFDEEKNYIIELPYEIQKRETLKLSEIRPKLEIMLNNINIFYQDLNKELEGIDLTDSSENNKNWLDIEDDSHSNDVKVLKEFYSRNMHSFAQKGVLKDDGKKVLLEFHERNKTLFLKDGILSAVGQVLQKFYEKNIINSFDGDSEEINYNSLRKNMENFGAYHDVISYLKTLYTNGRLQSEKNILKVIITESNSIQQPIPFEEFISPEKYFSDVLNLLNDKERAIYKNIWKYWLFGDESKTFLTTKGNDIDLADIVRTVKLLKSLGMLYSTKKQDLYEESILELYQTNRIFHPLFDGGYEK